MFGFRDTFDYLECGDCGCVQLVELPQEMRKYYPPNYYSFARHGRVKTFLRHRWSAYNYGKVSILGWLATTYFGPNRAIMSLARLKPAKNSRILDVGCGEGNLLLDLKFLAFENLMGADPYIANDIEHEGGPTVFKKEISEIPTKQDIIMLHHCFEHMDEPAAKMRSIAALLTQTGKAIIRIPFASSHGWKHYGINWVNLDAPRHFFLHSYKSFDVITKQAGLKIDHVVQEGDAGTFWASEAYARNIAMNEPGWPRSKPLEKVLGWKQNRTYSTMADEYNRKSLGDQVCFYLSKV